MVPSIIIEHLSLDCGASLFMQCEWPVYYCLAHHAYQKNTMISSPTNDLSSYLTILDVEWKFGKLPKELVLEEIGAKILELPLLPR
ncbi:Uncharacterized protein TCM_041191 [Theobroma cacao]|uniref:Uncharacterized protein n=1 Tax=Theobroma cacao TaxID=3641 RepID=A0A061GZL4_THECC|nr:Uncharacterized protein TCM_041191 [Theobroma cacao]